jgi:hypothetical protein
MSKEWTAEKFEPAEEHYDDFDEELTYCVYCYDEVAEWQQVRGCCGEIHFATGKELNDKEKELNEIDKQMKFMHEEIQQ